MRDVVALAVLLAGCGSTRPIEVPPPYDESGVVITLKPRAYVDWPLGLETIRGTAENRTGHGVDLRLYLNLVDDTGSVVGYASAFKDDTKRGAKWKFEADVVPGPPKLYYAPLFPEPPHYTSVARGFAYDDNSVMGLAVAIASLSEAMER